MLTEVMICLGSCGHCSRRGVAASCEFPADARPMDAPPAASFGSFEAMSRQQPIVWKTAESSDWAATTTESALAGGSSGKGKERADVDSPVAPQLTNEDGDGPVFFGSNFFGPGAGA
jgi:hypothetical protein